MEIITLFADRIETEIDGLLCIEFLVDETAEVLIISTNLPE